MYDKPVICDHCGESSHPYDGLHYLECDCETIHGPDTPTAFTAEELLGPVQVLYSVHGAGCCLHCTLDDGNYHGDGSQDLAFTIRNGCALCYPVALMLTKTSLKEKARLYRMYRLFHRGHPWDGENQFGYDNVIVDRSELERLESSERRRRVANRQRSAECEHEWADEKDPEMIRRYQMCVTHMPADFIVQKCVLCGSRSTLFPDSQESRMFVVLNDGDPE
jgi:hypothetical protein